MQLNLGGIEAVQAALLEVPSVVDTLGDVGAQTETVSRWMKKLETLLAAKRLPVAATVASHRAVLIAANRGRIHEEIEMLGKPGRSKLVIATASLVLEWTVSAVRVLLEPEEARYAEAASLAMQLVAVAQAKGMVAHDVGDGPSGVESIIGWLDSASADPDLAGGFAKLAALVGRKDSLRLLSRSLAQTQ